MYNIQKEIKLYLKKLCIAVPSVVETVNSLDIYEPFDSYVKSQPLSGEY